MSTYNGYTNYATWNVCLWIDNEYASYQNKILFFKSHEKLTPHLVQQFCQIELDGTTPDLTSEPGQRWSDVNWEEIAHEWNIESQELAA